MNAQETLELVKTFIDDEIGLPPAHVALDGSESRLFISFPDMDTKEILEMADRLDLLLEQNFSGYGHSSPTRRGITLFYTRGSSFCNS